MNIVYFYLWDNERSINKDAYVHTTLIKKWDICAGNAILNSLGGQLTTLKGEEINYAIKGEGDEKNKGGVLATMHNHQVSH